MNVEGRLALAIGDGYVDVETASEGAFASDVQGAFARWDDLRAWAAALGDVPAQPIPATGIGSPAPLPPQVFAIGLNYGAHALEGGTDVPEVPQVFTKFPASVTGPFDTVELPQGSVDYEAELVAVIGRRAHRVSEADAWAHVAGLTVGQDLSERQRQIAPPAPPQYSLAKSFAGFSPMGPVLVTADELDDPDALELSCRLNGEQMQHAGTADLIFSVPKIIEYLSDVVPLLPGDAIFTGTPSGIGFVRDPQVLLEPGDVLETEVKGIGTMVHRFVARAE
jgi:2-keto-4-pentenoate hydratase/2-oxohepta-3-ene-1,7-dioic acid hydratase in catechol pathway